MKIKFEELTKKQKQELQAIVAPSTVILRGLLFCFFTALVAFFFWVIEKTFSYDPKLWIVFTAVTAIATYFKSKAWTGGKKFRDNVRKDIANNKNKMISVTPIHVSKIEEIEDEGPSYIITDQSGEKILLIGQYLSEPKYKDFPWSNFSIVEAENSGLFFEISKNSVPIQVDEIRKPLEFNVLKEIGAFDRNYVLLTEPYMKLINET